MNMKKVKLFELEMPQRPCESQSAFRDIFAYCNINCIVVNQSLCHGFFFLRRDDFSLSQNKTIRHLTIRSVIYIHIIHDRSLIAKMFPTSCLTQLYLLFSKKQVMTMKELRHCSQELKMQIPVNFSRYPRASLFLFFFGNQQE